MLHVYAVVAAASEPVLGAEGLEGAELRLVAVGRVAAVVSEHGAPVEVSEDTVLRHARVVEHVAARVESVLPARFGDTLPDEETLRARLAGRSDALLAALERLRGRVELGLRVAAREGRPARQSVAAPAASGREYMAALRERAAGEARRVAEIHEPLAALAELARVDRRGDGALVLTAAYLVRPERVDDVRAEVARLQVEHRDLALVCTGPWPPYSFADAGEGAS